MPDRPVEIDLSALDPGTPIEALPREFGKATLRAAAPITGMSLGATASIRCFAFHGSTDDPDEVIADQGADAPPPPIVYSKDRAWTGYRCEASATASGSLHAVDGSAEAAIAFVDYRLHARGDAVGAAVSADLASPRFAVRLADVRALRPGEALSIRRHGSLGAVVELSWADALSSNLSRLGAALGTSRPLVLTLDSSLRLRCEVKASDDFTVVFSCIADSPRTYRAVVRKAATASAAGRAAVGVSLGPDGIDDAAADGFDRLLRQLTGHDWAEIRSLLEEGSDRRPESVLLAREILAALGADDPGAGLAELAERIGKLRGAVLDALREKVVAGFTYEYDRIRREEDLLQVELSDEQLGRYHGDLIAMGSRVLHDVADGTPGAPRLESFLRERSLESHQAWGFSLGLAKWKLAGKEERRRRFTVRETLEGHQQVVFLGTREYRRQWLDGDVTWSADLKASMPAYSRELAPRFDEFRYGLHLCWLETAAVTPLHAARWCDGAVLWGVADAASSPGLLEAVGHEGKATARIELRMAHGAFLHWLSAIASAGRGDFAEALAAAMPYEELFRVDRTAETRAAVYADLWRAYLAAPADPATFRLLARAHLEARAAAEHDAGLGTLAALEAEQNQAGELTFTGLLQRSPRTASAIDDFLAAARELDAGIRGAVPFGRREMLSIQGRLESFWTESHHVRAVGHAIAHAFDRNPAWGRVERTLTIERPDGATLIAGK